MKNPFYFKPKRCIIELTYKCNLMCQTCNIWQDSYRTYANRTHQISLDKLKDIQMSLAKSGIGRITYLGGEPFLYKDLLNLASHAKSCGLRTSVVTNGTLINKDIIEKIIMGNIFDIIIFSLDGPPHIHDAIRGTIGAFNLAADAIKNIQKLKKFRKLKYPKIFLYVTLSSLNYDYIESMLDIAQKLDINTIRFQSISCLDNDTIGKTNALFNSPAIKTHSYVIGTHLKIPQDKIPIVTRRLELMEKYSKNIGIKFQAEEYLKNTKGSQKCHFLGKDFVISSCGDIYPCLMLPDYVIGNATQMPINKILCDNLTKNKVEKLFELCSSKNLPVCSQCCVEKISLTNNTIDI